ncbi:hypothetical protein EBQ93_00720 [bacterium]|nr:hypothetical protein [bacterium]
MNRILFLIGLSLSASRIFCADEIERRIQEEWDRLEFALPGGNYSDIHRFHERIAAFMGDACYRKLQNSSKIFGETVDGTHYLMRDESCMSFEDLASALESVLDDYVAFDKTWQDMQSRYEEIYRLGTSVWGEKYVELPIAQDLEALINICSKENDQMLEQIDQIKEAVKNIIDPVTMALSNIIGFLEEYEQAIHEYGEVEDESYEDEASFSQLVLPVGLSDMKF